MVTSAHSNTISDWEESGDAITAIHGPLGADAAIGTTGARVSHGCVRLHDADLIQLRDVPAGTPLTSSLKLLATNHAPLRRHPWTTARGVIRFQTRRVTSVRH